jgi:DNA polymerase-3 subunit beta
MKFSMMQGDLLESLQVAANAVPQKSTLPILSHFLVEARDGKLTLTATDLDLSILTTRSADVEKEGRIAIPARKLLEMVREFPSERVDVSVDGSIVTISFGKGIGRFHLVTADPQDFPQIPKFEAGKRFTLPLVQFERAVERTIYAVSADDMRPEMNGVLFQLNKERFSLVATNGHRLSRMSVSGKFDAEADIIVPPKALNQVLRLAGGIEDLRVTMSKQYVLFEVGGTRIYSRLIEGAFPNYEQVIPKESKRRVTVNRQDFAAAVRRVAILADSITHQVKVTLQPKEIQIDVDTAGVGGGHETVAADSEGERLDIGFNAVYLQDILRSLDSDTIVIAFNTATSAAVVTPGMNAEGEDVLCLVMPLRLPE